MIMDRDMEIVRHLEKYHYATISQLQKIFFPHQVYSYNIVRKRLEEIEKGGYIRRPKRDHATNRNIYIYNDDKLKYPSQHRILTLDIYAEMKYMGFDIEHFEVEKHWIDDKKRGVYNDAFAVFTMDNRRYHYFIEVQISNNYHNLEKYDKLYEMGLVQQFYIDKDDALCGPWTIYFALQYPRQFLAQTRQI